MSRSRHRRPVRVRLSNLGCAWLERRTGAFGKRTTQAGRPVCRAWTLPPVVPSPGESRSVQRGRFGRTAQLAIARSSKVYTECFKAKRGTHRSNRLRYARPPKNRSDGHVRLISDGTPRSEQTMSPPKSRGRHCQGLSCSPGRRTLKVCLSTQKPRTGMLRKIKKHVR